MDLEPNVAVKALARLRDVGLTGGAHFSTPSSLVLEVPEGTLGTDSVGEGPAERVPSLSSGFHTFAVLHSVAHVALCAPGLGSVESFAGGVAEHAPVLVIEVGPRGTLYASVI